MNPITEARQHVATVLEAIGVNVYPYAPDAPSLPAAWVIPDGPWIRPRTLKMTTVDMRLQVANGVETRNRDALANLEDRAWAILTALRASGAEIREVGPPLTQTMGTLTVSVVEIALSITVLDDEGA